MRPATRIPVLATCLLTAAALSATAVAAAQPKPHRAAAAVVRVGAWSQLSAKHVTSLSEPNALQTGSGMQAIWYQEDTALTASIQARSVSGSGKVGASIVPVVKGWSTLVNDPKIIDNGADRMVVFSGLRSTSPGETYDGAMVYATSPTGNAWTLGTGSLSQTKSAYASYGTAALDDGGTPIVGVFASSTSYMTLHRGISPSIPAPSGDWTTTKSLGLYGYDGSLGQDARTGQVWAVWYSNASKKSQNGILAQKVYPTPIGSWVQAPGSSVKGNSLSPDQSVAVASRKGGQVWAAYKVGYPTANRIRLWRVGTKKTLTVSAKDARHVMLAPGLNGRLWLAWFSGASGTIKVTRTNTAVSRIGAVRTLKPPSKKGSYNSVYATAGTGLGGSLHLLVNSAIGTAKPQIWYQRVPPGLTVNASPGKLSSGRVTVKVTDAGSPVSGAKVVFRGSARKTAGNGTVVFRVSRAVKSGKYLITGFKRGFAKGSDSVRVT